MTQAVQIREGDWEEFGEAAGDIRRRVFIDEQAVPPEEEWDGRDAECRHFLALDDTGKALGTARLLPDGHIGRVAVLQDARGLGVGLALMKAAIASAQRRGDTSVALAAQIQALPFYERLGFQAHGDTFLDAGIPHRNMTLFLDD
ncbi:GNAT family N-acetyltransferase [Halomonas caseinilytica]|uniref:Predicted N-acyltransferase, GNAT family n=1 Tax=Halomonas caseinilytica TaxID=438744 RepID=A0A1M6N5V0_9GAMM|nr:GNAT family N-acetyltransferase [Halomonas caseinilytica]SEM49955.1 Predicted N-acyltransferase, GNAT family [Halomonas caseinilytica]SHJ91032.1 Predicted N-acyltransferase, GNAT family [Halomonas caseinilytica]